MIDRAIQEKRKEVEQLCLRFGVRRLDLFGSAATGEFRPDSSDLDLLVEFEAPGPDGYADAYFGLLEGLEELFHRPIDLVMLSAVTNPFFRKSVEKCKTLLYAA